MTKISDNAKKIIIRALDRELGRLVTKLETGEYFECKFIVEKRDNVYAAMIELGGKPGFLRERSRKLHEAFPFIPDLPVAEVAVAP